MEIAVEIKRTCRHLNLHSSHRHGQARNMCSVSKDSFHFLKVILDSPRGYARNYRWKVV